jgi:hypothetical protein
MSEIGTRAEQGHLRLFEGFLRKYAVGGLAQPGASA